MNILKTDYSLSVLRKRLFAVIAAITFLFCLFLARFFYVQVIWEDELNYLALDQWTREIPVLPNAVKYTIGTANCLREIKVRTACLHAQTP